MTRPDPDPAALHAWTEARRVGKRAMPRLWAALILVGCLVMLGVAGYLKPDARGFGTHQQLGGGPCGMLVMTGLPCPTCGMTTAFAYTVRGQWVRAFWSQPAGFVLALGTIGGAGVSAWTLIRGRWPRPNFALISPYRLFLALLVLLVGAWALKIVAGLADHSLPYR